MVFACKCDTWQSKKVILFDGSVLYKPAVWWCNC